jgi:hypothetical protein
MGTGSGESLAMDHMGLAVALSSIVVAAGAVVALVFLRIQRRHQQ